MRRTRWMLPAVAFASVALMGLWALSSSIARPPVPCNQTHCQELCAELGHGDCYTATPTCHFGEWYCYNQCEDGAILGEPLEGTCGDEEPGGGGSPIFRKHETNPPPEP